MKTHPYIFVIVCSLAYTLLTALLNRILEGQTGGINGFYLSKTLVTMLPIALMALPAFYLGLVGKGDFGTKHLAKGLLMGLPLLLLFFVLYDVGTLVAGGSWRGQATPLTLALLVLFQLTVAFSEELLCRGILFNALRDKHGESGRGLLAAVCLSSFIFGVMHFIGMMNGAPFMATLSQVLAAFFIGIFFCALYVRTGSLLAPIIVHALFNCFHGLKDVLYIEAAAPADTVTASVSMMDYFVIPLITLFFALYGLFLMRKGGGQHENQTQHQT